MRVSMGKALLATAVVAAVVAAITVAILGGPDRLDALDESIAARSQDVAELWQSVDRLERKVKALEGREVLMIVGTGHRIVIRTVDGEVLHCYMPDGEKEKRGK